MARLFGTDGVRGIANETLDCELALAIGAAGARVLTSRVSAPKILIGTDTRVSADMLAYALAAGVCSVGGNAIMAGVLPTPGLAYLVRHYGADAAVVVSASHNSMEYNGIKWFNAAGYKLPDELEDEIEARIRDKHTLERPVGGAVGRVTPLAPGVAAQDYRDFLQASADVKLEGMRLVLDCANGAASHMAREVFSGLGAQVLCFFDAPDGVNINEGCGSTHPERLSALVLEHGAHAGFAFDGDADRLIAVDELGHIVDGDSLLGILALDMKARGTLKQDTLVITVMSNLGLKRRMQEANIRLEETAVGDRYVLERMIKLDLNLGGEQSGHLIFRDHHTTGDGMLSCIQLLNTLKRSTKPFSALAAQIPIFPQVLLNVRVSEQNKEAAMADKDMLSRIQGAEQVLGGLGRVLVRASGTEPLIRIMLEGQNTNEIQALAQDIAGAIGKF